MVEAQLRDLSEATPELVTPFTGEACFSPFAQLASFLTLCPHCPLPSRAGVSSRQNGIPHLESQSHTLKQPGCHWEAPKPR